MSTNSEVTGMTPPAKRSTAKAGVELKPAALEEETLTTRPPRLSPSATNRLMAGQEWERERGQRFRDGVVEGGKRGGKGRVGWREGVGARGRGGKEGGGGGG